MRLILAAAIALAVMPPVTGSMYNGNNSEAVHLEDRTSPPPADQGDVTTTGARSGQSNEGKAGGGN